MLHSHPGPYLAVRKQLVNLTLHTAAALHLSQETAHTALALMDRCVMAGIHLTDNLQVSWSTPGQADGTQECHLTHQKPGVTEWCRSISVWPLNIFV